MNNKKLVPMSKEEEFMHKCARALEMTDEIIGNAYGSYSEETKDRLEAFKII